MFGGSRINTTCKPIKAVVGGFGGLFHGHKAFPQFLNFTLDILHVRFDFGHSIPDVFQLHNHGGKLGGFLGGVFLIVALQVGNTGMIRSFWCSIGTEKLLKSASRESCLKWHQ